MIESLSDFKFIYLIDNKLSLYMKYGRVSMCEHNLQINDHLFIYLYKIRFLNRYKKKHFFLFFPISTLSLRLIKITPKNNPVYINMTETHFSQVWSGPVRCLLIHQSPTEYNYKTNKKTNLNLNLKKRNN